MISGRLIAIIPPYEYGVIKDFPFECTNLISFRSDIQKQFNVPVYDMVSLIELFADGYVLKFFGFHYISGNRKRI